MNKYEIQQLEKHCVFRCGSQWFAVPAVAVREVTPRPALVRVPESPPTLAGLCHLRNEFLPVLSLRALLEDAREPDLDSQQMLIMESSANASWAVLVDAVSALAALDVAVNTECRSNDAWSAMVMGSATCRDEIVRVLDPNAVYRLASQVLEPTDLRDASALIETSPLGSLEVHP